MYWVMLIIWIAHKVFANAMSKVETTRTIPVVSSIEFEVKVLQ